MKTFDLVLRIVVCIIGHIHVEDPLAPWSFEELAVVLDDDDYDDDDNHNGGVDDVADDAGSSYDDDDCDDDDDENDIDFVPMHIVLPTVELQFPTLVDASIDGDADEHPPD